MGPLGESGGQSVGRCGESDVENWHLQRCSPCICQFMAVGLIPVRKY
jgi:hypothetical protein